MNPPLWHLPPGPQLQQHPPKNPPCFLRTQSLSVFPQLVRNACSFVIGAPLVCLVFSTQGAPVPFRYHPPGQCICNSLPRQYLIQAFQHFSHCCSQVTLLSLVYGNGIVTGLQGRRNRETEIGKFNKASVSNWQLLVTNKPLSPLSKDMRTNG